jgi:hypothetical protein
MNKTQKISIVALAIFAAAMFAGISATGSGSHSASAFFHGFHGGFGHHFGFGHGFGFGHFGGWGGGWGWGGGCCGGCWW